MCGICGFTSPQGGGEPDGGILERMLQSLSHRGPDASGTLRAPGVALGHARLSIIDLVSGGQPMRGESGAVIVFNGEVYNYGEIRADLEARGRRFRTDSDTEVMLAAYEEFGERCLERFIGMFAFVIHDPARRVLFMARDRLGKKPFFYLHDGARFVFASEIKAILAHPAGRGAAGIDFQALSDYLSMGYILAPKTIFAAIRKLPAGHSAVLGLDDGSLRISSYWDLAGRFLAEKSRDPARNAERFLELLHSAVSLRLRSDVPLGAFLSGGVDSSTVAACMKRVPGTDVRTFCVGFAQDSYDESPFAALAASHLGVSLERIEQPMPHRSELARMVWHLDEPFCDTSIVPSYLISQAAARRVKVILTGDGADEILAGYPTYLADKAHALYRHVPGPLQRGLLALARAAVRPSYAKVSWDYKLLRFLEGGCLASDRAHYHWRVIFTDQEKRAMLSDEALAACAAHDPFDAFAGYAAQVPGASLLDRALYTDIKTWLQDDILVKVDRMSMAHSLEARSPFLDHRLVEFAAALPDREKLDGLRQKAVLKRCMRGVLPGAILDRGKRGFNFPGHLVSRGCVRPPDDPALFDRRFHLCPEREDVTYKSFSLLILGLWLDMHTTYLKTGRWEPASYE